MIVQNDCKLLGYLRINIEFVVIYIQISNITLHNIIYSTFLVNDKLFIINKL